MPVSGRVLARLLEGLRLSSELTTSHGIKERTLRRYLAGDRVEVSSIVSIIKAAVEALLDDEVADLAQVEREVWDQLKKEASLSVHHYLKLWDRTAATVNGHKLWPAAADQGVMPVARLVLIDLSLRLAAVLRLQGVRELDPELAGALEAGTGFRWAIAAYRSCGDATREALVRDTGVSASTFDKWTAGRDIPQSENILQLAHALAEGAGLKPPHVALGLRVAAASSLLTAGLVETLGAWRTRMLVRATLDIVEFALSFMWHSRADPAELRLGLLRTVHLGARWRSCHFILRATSRLTDDRHHQADLDAVQGEWTGRLVTVFRELRGADDLRRRLAADDPALPGVTEQTLDMAMQRLLLMPRLGASDLRPQPPHWLATDEEYIVNELTSVGNAAFSTGDAHKAAEAFRRAALMRPENAMYHFWLGAALSKAGNRDAAITECKIAAGLKPEWDLPEIEVGIILLDHDQPKAALHVLNDISKRFTPTRHLVYSTGVALMRLGRFPEATESFERALKLKPGYAPAQDLLAHCYLMARRKRDGLTLAKEAAHNGVGDTLAAWHAGRYASLFNPAR